MRTTSFLMSADRPRPSSATLLRRIGSPPLLCLLAVGSIALASAAPARAAPWPSIKPEDLALKQGQVDAEADAEATEWEIVVSDEWSGETIKSSESQRRRVKLFNARGLEAFRRIDIPYSKGTLLTDVSARTIRPDGSVIEVKKDAILDRTIAKGAGLKEKVKSFAMPGIELGCIVEYRWTSVRYDELTHNVRIPFQLDIPVELLRFSIHPLPVPDSELQMRIRAFNFHLPPFTDDGLGFHTVTIPSLPASHHEPFMPPQLSVRPWIAIYYETESENPVDAYWRRFGKAAYASSVPRYKASGDVKRATQAALAGVTDQDQVVERLVDYCRAKIRNSDVSDSGLTADERSWLNSDHSAADYLKRGLADGDGLLRVFLSMASAAGLDARLGLLPDRSECVFDSKSPTYYLLTRSCAAVQVLGSWLAIDPSAVDLPHGMLPWSLQGVEMLIPDPQEPTFVRTPISPPEQSLRRRSAQLRLSEDGTVEGDITDEITGQDGAIWRRGMRDHSPVERERMLTDEIKARMSTAEITNIVFDPGPGPSEPFRLRYHIRVDGYASRTGHRLFLQPAFFQRGMTPIFPARDRKYPACFAYGWAERDVVTIDLPAHFHLENLPGEKPIVLPQIGSRSSRVLLSDDGRQLQFARSMIFGEGGTLWFPVEEYPKLKDAFDRTRAQDDGVVSLASDEALQR